MSETITEGLLKEIERQERTQTLYGKIEIDVFDLQTGNQTRKWWQDSRYFATTNNKIQLESKIEMKNPLDFIGKILFITLVCTTQIDKQEMATKEEIEEIVQKVSEYMISIISRLFEEKHWINSLWDNVNNLRKMERWLYGWLEEWARLG